MMGRIAAFLLGVSLALFGTGAARAQLGVEIMVPQGVDIRFDPSAVTQRDYGAAVIGSVRALSGHSILPPEVTGHGLTSGEVDPYRRTAVLRAQRDSTPGPLGAGYPGSLTAEARAVVDDYRLQSNPLTSLSGNVAELGGNEPLLNLSPAELLRYEELSRGVSTLTFDQLAEMQELYRRGMGNPDPGTPGVPSQVPGTLPQGPLVLGGMDACSKVVDNSLLCRHLNPEGPSYQQYCTCN
ncbi:hypothetical protein [Pseudooceanicola marinus]|uniref:hypothetical protein n=1 Tax=Pseudooceanicola marinus TaxID=396013 RepID=UPI001CD20B69|nr:hypothetical protein [Pseudooceanicola marinus]MCA1335528.1 hypothetical protein [Pseudooceanicola marinus]